MQVSEHNNPSHLHLGADNEAVYVSERFKHTKNSFLAEVALDTIVVGVRQFGPFCCLLEAEYILYPHLMHHVHIMYILYVYIQLYTYLAGRPDKGPPATNYAIYNKYNDQ